LIQEELGPIGAKGARRSCRSRSLQISPGAC
jgi:hypothetical protein